MFHPLSHRRIVRAFQRRRHEAIEKRDVPWGTIRPRSTLRSRSLWPVSHGLLNEPGQLCRKRRCSEVRWAGTCAGRNRSGFVGRAGARRSPTTSPQPTDIFSCEAAEYLKGRPNIKLKTVSVEGYLRGKSLLSRDNRARTIARRVLRATLKAASL